MPANLNEQQVQGTQLSWIRCKGFTGFNEYGGVPRIIFKNEKVTILVDGEIITTPRPDTFTTYSPGTTFPLINPQTEEVMGEASDELVYAVIYSKWLAMQKPHL